MHIEIKISTYMQEETKIGLKLTLMRSNSMFSEPSFTAMQSSSFQICGPEHIPGIGRGCSYYIS